MRKRDVSTTPLSRLTPGAVLTAALWLAGCHLVWPFGHSSPDSTPGDGTIDGVQIADGPRDLESPDQRRPDARADGAKLDGAKLDSKKLDGAKLDGKKLDGAKLDGPKLDGKKLDAGPLIPSHKWSKRFGGVGDDRGFGVAMDTSGNCVLTGYHSGGAAFGAAPLTSAGGTDGLIASFNAAGTHVFSKGFGSGGADMGWAVAVDGQGRPAITGYLSGMFDFGAGIQGGHGLLDLFVVAYDSAGAYRFSQVYGASANEYGFGIATDSNGNVLVTGSFFGSVSFGGATLASQGIEDIVLAKYSSAGSHSRSTSYGGNSADRGYAVAVDASGNVFVTGDFSDSVTFGGAGALTSSGSTDIFLASYSSTGTHRFSKRFGAGSADSGRGLAVDGAGNVYVVGLFSGTVNLGGTAFSSKGGTDAFVASYTTMGAHRFSRAMGSPGADVGNGVAADSSGNVTVTGEFASTMDCGGSTLVSAGDRDVFLASYTSTGAHRYSQSHGAANYDAGRAVAAHPTNGSICVVGHFEGSASFGGSALVSAGSEDIFLVRLAP